MSIFILFGPPGAGKTFVGKIFQESFGFHFYDGDEDLTPRMKWAIDHRVPITDSQRDEFFSGLIESIKRLNQTQPHLVIAQTFIKGHLYKLKISFAPNPKGKLIFRCFTL